MAPGKSHALPLELYCETVPLVMVSVHIWDATRSHWPELLHWNPLLHEPQAPEQPSEPHSFPLQEGTHPDWHVPEELQE